MARAASGASRHAREPSAPRCVSGCVMSSVSQSCTRIDEAVAPPRVTVDAWEDGCAARTGGSLSCTHMTMTKRDDESLAKQNAEIRRWAEANGLTVGAKLGQQQDAVERFAPRVPVVEFTVSVDEDVYEAAMLRATSDGYDNASEVVEAALREWARGY